MLLLQNATYTQTPGRPSAAGNRLIRSLSCALKLAAIPLALGCSESTLPDHQVTTTVELHDDFERPDAIGLAALGSALTGQPWEISGQNAYAAAIESGKFTGGPQITPGGVYAYMRLSRKIKSTTFKFSFVPGTGTVQPVIATAISSDSTLIPAHLHALHLVISSNNYYLTLYNGGGPFDLSSGVASGSLTPLKVDGTEYSCTITISGTKVTINFPDGSTYTGSDPLIPTLTGRLIFFEHVYDSNSSQKTRFHEVSASVE
jgi:hypothetical protein